MFRKEPEDFLPDPRQDLLEVLLGRRREWMESGLLPFSVGLVDAVENERVQVRIQGSTAMTP